MPVSRVTAYLSHLSALCVCVRGPAAEASTYKIWRVTPSAWVGGSALLLRVSFRGVLSPTAFVATSIAWLTLPITLVVLWVVATARRAPSPWKASVAVPICGVLATLDCNPPRTSDICRLCSLQTDHRSRKFNTITLGCYLHVSGLWRAHLLPLHNIELYDFSITHTTEVLPGVVLLDCCLKIKEFGFEIKNLKSPKSNIYIYICIHNLPGAQKHLLSCHS